MMFLVFGALLFVSTTYAGSEPDNGEGLLFQLTKSMFEKRCIKNASPQVAEDLLSYARLLSKCIPKEDLVPLQGESGQDRLNYICSPLRAQAEACVRKLGTKIAPCLHAEESYIHDFLVHTVDDTFIKICSEESRALRKELDTNAVARCMDKQIDIVKQCVKDSGLIEAFQEPEPIVKKFDLCAVIGKIQKCADTTTHDKCKNKAVATYIGSRYSGFTSQCDCHNGTKPAEEHVH